MQYLWTKNLYKKIYFQKIFQIFLSAFDIEKGFIYTAIMLFLNPEKVINEYLSGRTKDYFNPFNYLLIIAGVSVFLTLWLNVTDIALNASYELMGVDEKAVPAQKELVDFITQYANVITVFLIPFLCLVSKWYLKKIKLYYGEHLILYCYILAQTSLINIAIFPVYIIFPESLNYFIQISLRILN